MVVHREPSNTNPMPPGTTVLLLFSSLNSFLTFTPFWIKRYRKIITQQSFPASLCSYGHSQTPQSSFCPGDDFPVATWPPHCCRWGWQEGSSPAETVYLSLAFGWTALCRLSGAEGDILIITSLKCISYFRLFLAFEPKAKVENRSTSAWSSLLYCVIHQEG